MKLFLTKWMLVVLAICGTLQVNAQEKPLRVVCIGNSFTFFHDSNKRLEEIAASQGHNLSATPLVVGGYTFHRHIINDNTMGNLAYSRYDVALLQDQSQTPALCAQDTVRCRLFALDAAELAERVRCYSPNAKVWIEHTWAYSDGNFGGFGSMECFDRLLRDGAAIYARKSNAMVSPIGEAFAIVRAERPDINLYDRDNKHQSGLGTYLKSCINYLNIYQEPFHGEVANCSYDPQACQYLRSVAERVVLKGERVIK